jgi:hypothetical protein
MCKGFIGGGGCLTRTLSGGFMAMSLWVEGFVVVLQWVECFMVMS